ncbi:alpha/beta hydrolase [Streptomyces sp. PA03-1a]|nr:alpha/beta hydrolase [Streptomyces sp. PA03-1a]
MRRAVVLAVSLVLAAGAATAPAAGHSPDPLVAEQLRMAGATVAARTAGATGIVFGACPADSGLKAPVQCGTVRVPVDYAEPGGATIGLLVSRLRAAGPASVRQGALVFNPGGPGSSGLWFPAVGRPGVGAVTRKVWETAARTYDLVGFDPRGVGHSAPLSCQDPAGHQRSPGPDPRLPTAAVKAAKRAEARRTADNCGARGGALLRNMRTADLARDLDVIRAALGEPRLNYYGVSYGTYLGAVYATLFPSHVRRMVVDSVVNPDPRGVWYGANLAQDVAFERRWADWRTWAAGHDRVYGLGATPGRVQASFDRAMRMLGKRPAGKVGAGELHSAAVQAAYYDQRWASFAHLLSRYLHGDDDPLVDAAAPDPGQAKDEENSEAVYLAVECSDGAWPRDWSVWDRDNSRIARQRPFETWANAWLNLPCASWPVQGGRAVDVGARPGSGLPPVLIVQSERDAATPYEGAVELHRRLPGSRMITEEGRGSHGLISFWNECVTARVDRYLISGATGDRDIRCSGHPLPAPSGRDGAEDANTGRFY